MKIKAKTYWLILLYSVIILIFSFGGKFFVFDFTARVIGELLFELVQVNDKSEYQISSKKISYYPIKKKLFIEDLKIFPSKHADDSTTRYDVTIPSLFVGVESILEVYFERNLSITNIQLFEPHAHVNNELKISKSKDEKISAEAGDLYKILSKYLRKLKVKSFDLDNGSVTYGNEISSHTKITGLSLFVNDFSMDSTNLASSASVFHTEAIRLHVDKQHFKIEDSGHWISFDSLLFSSLDSTFRLHNVKIDKTYSDQKKDSLSIALVSFDKIDMNDLYNKHIIDLGVIKLHEPHIHMRRIGNSKTKKISSHILNNSNYLINIDSINVDNGIISIESEDLNVVAENLFLRHGAHRVPSGKDLFIFDEFLSQTELSCYPLSISGKKVNLHADSLQLDGNLHHYNLIGLKTSFKSQNQTIEYNSPFASFKSLTISSENRVLIDSIWLDNPNIYYELNGSKVVNSKRKVNGFDIRYLNMTSGDVSINLPKTSIEFQNLNVEGSNLSDTLSYDNLSNLVLVSDEISVTQDTLNVTIQSSKYDGAINHLDAYVVESKFGRIDQFGLYNLRMVDLVENGMFIVDTVLLSKAELNFTPTNDTSSVGLKKSIAFERILADQINLDVTNKGQMIKLRGLGFNIDAEMKFDSLILSSFNLSDSSLLIDSKNIRYVASDTTLIFDATGIAAGKRADVKADSIALVIPLNLKTLSKSDSLVNSIYNVVFYQPQIVIGHTSLVGGSEKKQGIIPPFKIINGKLNVTTNSNNISASDVYISSNQPIQSGNIIQDLSDDEAHFKNVKYSSNNRNIDVDALDYKSGALTIENANGGVGDNIEFSIQNAEVDNLNLALLTQGSVSMDSMIIDGADFKVKFNENEEVKTKTVKPVSLMIPLADVQGVNLNFIWPNKTLSTSNASLRISNFDYNGIGEIDPPNIMELAGDSVSYINDDIGRSFGLGSFEYSNQLKAMTIADIVSAPTVSEQVFTSKLKLEADWIRSSVKSVNIAGFELNDFLETGNLNANLVTLSEPDLFVYRDKRLPDPTTFKRLFHAQLTNSKREIEIDSIIIQKGSVHYDEKLFENKEPAEILFSNLSGRLSNLYSNPAKIESSPQLSLSARGNFMGGTAFETEVVFHTMDTSGNFTMAGKIGNMDMTTLNSVLENSGHVRINSGICKLLEFEFDATNDYAVGDMKFFYDKLHVTFLNRENKRKGFGSAFKTFFANTFVVNRKNPHFIFLRKGDIYSERLKNRAMFNYWSHALLSGMVSSIGARNNKKEIRRLNRESKEK